MSILFTEEHIRDIKDGTKTATRRDWDNSYNKPNEGTIHMAVTELFQSKEECDCFIRIKRVYQEPLGSMTDADADAEGGYSVEEFKKKWIDINGEWSPSKTVSVVEFEFIGSEAT